MRPRIHSLFVLLISAGCSTHADSVCHQIGYCRTFTIDQVNTCKADVKTLAAEASSSGCSPQYDAYFACADDHYDCQGNVPTFNGCEGARAALDDCLANGRAMNACGELANALAACGEATPADPSLPPAPCGATEVCSSRCYLDNVTDVCFPQPIQLSRASQCSQQCL